MTEQLTFPFRIDDPRRMMPTEFIAASLFSALNRSSAPVFRDKLTDLGRFNGYRLRYKGRVLTQEHADMWLAALEILRRRGAAMDGNVHFRASEMLSLLGKTNHADNRRELLECLTDMSSCTVIIEQPGHRSYFGPILFGAFEQSSSTGEMHYALALHRDLVRVFDYGHAALNWPERRALGKSELALWLQPFLIACGSAEPIRIVDLQAHSWQTGALPQFRQRLKIALSRLETVGLLARWSIDAEDRLHVELRERGLPPSQSRPPKRLK